MAAGLAVRFDGRSAMWDGDDVSWAIRSHEVTQAASMVAVHPGVRAEAPSGAGAVPPRWTQVW